MSGLQHKSSWWAAEALSWWAAEALKGDCCETQRLCWYEALHWPHRVVVVDRNSGP